MRNITSFIINVNNTLETLTENYLEKITRFGGLSPQDWITKIVNPTDYSVDHPQSPAANDIIPFDQITDSVTQTGQEFLVNSKTACVVYLSPHVKVPFTTLIDSHLNFLSLKQLQTVNISDVWYVVPASVFEDFKNHLLTLSVTNNVKVFKQFELLELTPDNRIVFNDNQPLLCSTGTGDLFDVLKENGTLQDFIESGGKYLYIIDLMNVTATPDPALLGQHIESGYSVTCEITQRIAQENGALFCNFMGINQLIENFRLTSETVDDFEWIGTGTFVINADLNFESFQWPFHRMKRNTNGTLVIQYERFLNDITSFFKTLFVAVERKQKYVSIKSEEDLKSLSDLFSTT